MVSLDSFIAISKYWRMFLDGFICTVLLSALTVVLGFILALVLALMRKSDFRPFKALGIDKNGAQREGFLGALSRFNPLSFISACYVEVIRATPMLVQLFFVYYVLFANIRLPHYMLFGFIRFERFLPGVLALGLNSGAYLSEIIRSGIQSIDGGQTEAARSLGLSGWQAFRLVVLPQAIKNILPAIANEFVTIIKESSITYTIGVQDLMYAVNSVKGSTFSIIEPLIVSAVIYFLLTFPTSKIIAHFEKKMSAGDFRNTEIKVKKRKQLVKEVSVNE